MSEVARASALDSTAPPGIDDILFHSDIPTLLKERHSIELNLIYDWNMMIFEIHITSTFDRQG